MCSEKYILFLFCAMPLRRDEMMRPEISGDSEEGELALDIFETEKSFFLVAPVAGVQESSVDIALTEDLLTISGVRPRPDSLPSPQHSFLQECYWGDFSRSVLLPSAVNSADIEARLHQDIIIVEVPKARKVTSGNIPLSHF